MNTTMTVQVPTDTLLQLIDELIAAAKPACATPAGSGPVAAYRNSNSSDSWCQVKLGPVHLNRRARAAS